MCYPTSAYLKTTYPSITDENFKDLAILQISKLYHMFYGDSKVMIRWRDINGFAKEMETTIYGMGNMPRILI
jgi:hypothetical protein